MGSTGQSSSHRGEVINRKHNQLGGEVTNIDDYLDTHPDSLGRLQICSLKYMASEAD